MNAEQLQPEWTGRFDMVTCVWLFHELPHSAIERVTAEMARVLKPGGTLVFMDAAQPCDTSQGDPLQLNEPFQHFFSEPYFMDYIQLDLPELFSRHGLSVLKTERWHLSKLMTLRKEQAQPA
jgi:ubiquinone/menaquinone biosynthesis C-methylase UbiE